MKTYKTDYYQILKLRKLRKIEVKKIWLPYGRWYCKKYNLRGKVVLDFGSNIESDFFKKFKSDNKNTRKGKYYGFDLDRDAVGWLKENKFYYDFYKDDKLRCKFDIVNASQVYEHLSLEEREAFIKRSWELLKKGGVLLLDFPYINNLNLIEFFHGDRTHKPVSCEDEANYIALLGFRCRVYIGGLTWPYQSVFKNMWIFFWNIVLGFYPFHITLIEATKK